MAKKPASDGMTVIQPANIVRTTIEVVGMAPFVQNKFPQKARQMMMRTMAASPADRKKIKSERGARDYDADFIGAQHIAEKGWNGIPCVAFRAAMIDACRTTGIPMTVAKMSVFIIADGIDKDDGTSLVKIIGDKPEKIESLVKNETGVADIRIRPMWRKWGAKVQIEFDADMISAESVVNLLDRAGRQVGIGEGRNFSKKSVGQGWGSFVVVTK